MNSSWWRIFIVEDISYGCIGRSSSSSRIDSASGESVSASGSVIYSTQSIPGRIYGGKYPTRRVLTTRGGRPPASELGSPQRSKAWGREADQKGGPARGVAELRRPQPVAGPT